MWTFQSSKMNQTFVSMNPMKMGSNNTNKSRMKNLIDKSFGWVLFWRNRPKKVLTTTMGVTGGGYTISPERTALMSFDDLSTFHDISHCYMNNHTSSSYSESDSVPPISTTEDFPSWHSNYSTNVGDPKLKEETRKRRSLLYAFHNARIRSLSNVGKVEHHDDINDNNDGDDESAHFSISTDLRYQPTISEPQKLQIQSADTTSYNDTTVSTASTVHPPPPPTSISDTASVRTSRSVQSMRTSRSSTRSMRSAKSMLGSVGNRSRMSLDQFLDDRTQASSLITGPFMAATTNLGDLPADFDAMSVGTSASLDVSFHGEYPQLVLTPSVDGTASRMTDGSIETNTGAASTSLPRTGKKYNARITVSSTTTTTSTPIIAAVAAPTTPASSNRSIASFDTTKRNVSCTPQWLNDNIDRVWKQFDQCKADPDGRYAPEDDPYDSNTDQNDVDDYMPYNTTEADVNVFQYKFNNGHISECNNNRNSDDDDNDDDMNKLNSDDSIDFTATEEEENTDDDDIDAMFDTTTDEETNGEDERKEQEIEIVTREVINVTEKEDQFSFRSFSPFDDMGGWSFSAGSTTGGKSISKMIETEVIYPILKPICELVEATEIPEARRNSSTTTSYHRRQRALSTLSPPPPTTTAQSEDNYHHQRPKHTSYRMSPHRYKSRNIIR